MAFTDLHDITHDMLKSIDEHDLVLQNNLSARPLLQLTRVTTSPGLPCPSSASSQQVVFISTRVMFDFPWHGHHTEGTNDPKRISISTQAT